MRSATPSPQAPFTSSAPTMILGSQPPATPIPFIGITTNQATELGPSAPMPRAFAQYAAPRDARIKAHNTIPQTPPQNASEITAGALNGGTGVMFHGARADAPAAYSSASKPWWNTSVDAKPAMNDFTWVMGVSSKNCRRAKSGSGFRQIRVDELHCSRAFAHGRGNPLDRAAAHIADGEHARVAGLESHRRARRPDV